jgi:hypothetical protein
MPKSAFNPYAHTHTIINIHVFFWGGYPRRPSVLRFPGLQELGGSLTTVGEAYAAVGGQPVVMRCLEIYQLSMKFHETVNRVRFLISVFWAHTYFFLFVCGL